MASPSFDLTPTLPVQPRQWQSQLIQLLKTRLSAPTPAGHDVLVHAGPGAGKTLGALLGVLRLRHERKLQHVVVFCHRTAIAGQWIKAAERLGLRLESWSPNRPTAPAAGPQGLLLSYQAAALQQDALSAWLEPWSSSAWIAIADEVHHLGVDPDNPEAAAWGTAFSTVTRPAALRLGLSGTPFRADQLAFCAARRICVRHGQGISERIVPDLCVEPRQLIAAG
ncbi:MAG: DEAD/DEAH box helicase, partial [Cyanobacteria bacterium K_DeepCast_35m_m2_023]|nr:DEAD/DEAH box helicase [Cyanobacteria bacterium K_DeepCast_35m_m2_023]